MGLTIRKDDGIGVAVRRVFTTDSDRTSHYTTELYKFDNTYFLYTIIYIKYLLLSRIHLLIGLLYCAN